MPSRTSPERRLEGRLRALAGAALAVLACGRSQPAPAPAEALDESRVERRPSTPSAFDLVAAEGGGMLVWAGNVAPVLHLERFDAAGQAVGGDAARVVDGGAAVADVAGVAVGAARVIAWSEAGVDGRRLRAAWVPAAGPARGFDLGPVDGELPVARGSVALAASGQGARLFARGAATTCVDASELPCQAFQFFAIDERGPRPTGLALAVPSPCASQAAQLAPPLGVRGRVADESGPIEYAVCSRAQADPALTIFSIRPSPAYAMAREVFAGCTPLGAARFGGDAAFVALCGQERRLARVDRESGNLSVESLEPRGLVCAAGGPSLRLGSGWLRPSDPLGGLELLLGEDLAPPGSRAIWTGAALLVARLAADGTLALARHACRGAALVELGDVPYVRGPIGTGAGGG